MSCLKRRKVIFNLVYNHNVLFEESFFLILCKEVVITLVYNLRNSTADKHFSTQGIADECNCFNGY